ncbi:SWFGD domain-containing protein [Sphingomicrobium arenosum]|uniref:SWFGD domain-containing protein n=1 Tax=Sphingomicrobium arenosum TaxID=2233861 RepID=UPI00223F7655|nr:SWFGD domain-containing protein [Sphingomicrobium arenosum]
MAYDRYDRTRNRGDDRFETGRDRPRGRMTRDQRLDYDRDDRDFFDRASDEVRSWFGDDRAERRRQLDERYGYAGDGCRNQHFDFEDNFSSVNEGYRRPYDEGGRSYGRSSMRVDDDHLGRRAYGRSQAMNRSQRVDMDSDGDFDRTDRYDYDRGYTQNRWGRAQTQGEFTRDRDYDEWRTRQIDALDRDYDEWRSENQARFDDEFTSWRESRQQKRQQLRELGDNCTVVGSDGEPIGSVSSIRGDRMILKGQDDDTRCVFSLRNVDEISDNQVRLNLSSDDARRRMRDDEERMSDRSMSDSF